MVNLDENDSSLFFIGMFSVMFIVVAFYYYSKFGEKAWPVITCCFVFISFALGAMLGEWKMRKKYEVKDNG